MKKLLLAAMIGLFLFSLPTRAEVILLHHFNPSNVHGTQPYGELVSDGTYLYGMASRLGQGNSGTIFRINSDGSGYLLLHAFAGGGTDGRSPYGSLVLSGTTLYGMTYAGGDMDLGTIFRIEKDGTAFTLLHEFAGGADDGANPSGSLIVSSSTLYGMTQFGGDSNVGTIFKIGTAGTAFTLLHEFSGGAADGAWPTYGSLIISGSTLYGTTVIGGDANVGTVFKLETTGSGYTLLHEFAGGNDDGAAPIGFLVLSGSTLYGMTRDGGDINSGMIYKLETSGAGYTLLHEFSGGAADGDSPQGSSMLLSGSTLYGMTFWGGDSNMGTVFKMETSGSGFALLKEFSDSDGKSPWGSLLLIGSTLYGMTRDGGSGGLGSIFKIETAGTGFASLFSFAGVSGCDGGYPRGTPVLSGTTLYGVTPQGGVNNLGAIFKMETNGTGYALLHEFSYSEGIYPYGSLFLSGSTLFGMTSQGGSNNRGTIFKIETTGSGFSVLHEFAGGAAGGSSPYYGNLILSGSTLYGLTYQGGSSDLGTIFKIETNGTGFSVLHSFTGGATDGKNPYGSLVLSGSTLFGMTYLGGSSDLGTLFKIETTGSGFSLLHSFAGGTLDGANPRGDLLLSGSTLYGMTGAGGNINYGTVFKIGTAGNDFALLHTFGGGGDDGRLPNGSLVLSGSGLYGMTYRGGDSTLGTVFMMKNDGTGFSLLHEFAGKGEIHDGAYPYGSLLIANGALFGMTQGGGSMFAGVLFSLPIPGITVTQPNGGEIWMAGTADAINWTSTGTITNVNVDYSTNSGGSWTSVAANTANDGTHPWTVPSTPSTTCLVRVSDAADGFPSDTSNAAFTIVVASPPTLTVTSPNGGENWTVGENHNITWTSTGTIGDLSIYWSTNSGSQWSQVVANTANDGSFNWTVPNTPSTTCLVRIVDAADSDPSDSSNAVFTIAVVAAETVSAPSQPSGISSGLKDTSYSFSTGGSTSSLGHAVQYKFDWDDGSDSGWLAGGTTQSAHAWSGNGIFDVRAMARCVTHTTIESLWSETHSVTITDATAAKYNSPAQQKVLPEVIWAAATGGGTWMSEVQVTDISGDSQVSVYYNTAAGRRGPFLLWNNSGGGARRSQKYTNMLQTIDGLDTGVFTYIGTVGAVEFITQDAAHVLQVMARTLNGSYSKTFPALSLHDSNTADTSRVLIVPNLTNNIVYRSTCGMFNPTAAAVTLAVSLFDSDNTQVGTTITKTVNGYGFTAFSPFNDAGVPYPANSYDNIILRVQPTSGTGKVFCFGASANNATNDPAAHLAVQNSAGHDNGPSGWQILPEAIWAIASGGGTWMSEVQIVDVSGGSTVSAYFDYGGGNRRGPFALWSGSGAGTKVKYANILQQLGTIDNGFSYYGRVGTVEFYTQGVSNTIQVTARTLNGDYSKTFPGLNSEDAERADTYQEMLIQNYTSNSTYRSTCGFFNTSADALTVEFTLLNGSGVQIGSTITKTFVGYDFQAFSPFNDAGVPYPANTYDNVILRVRPTSGSGKIICFGASASNASNDPAAHIAVQGQ